MTIPGTAPDYEGRETRRRSRALPWRLMVEGAEAAAGRGLAQGAGHVGRHLHAAVLVEEEEWIPAHVDEPGDDPAADLLLQLVLVEVRRDDEGALGLVAL